MTGKQQSSRPEAGSAVEGHGARSKLRGVLGLVGLLAGFSLVNALLLGPRWVAAGRVGPEWIAFEVVAIGGVFALLPARRWAVALAWAAAVALGVVSLLAAADAAIRLSLGRSLNLLLDFRLIGAVHHLLTGILGAVGATLTMGALLVVVACAILGLARLLAPRPGGRTRRSLLGAGTLLGAGLLWIAATLSGPGGWVALPAVTLVAEQAERLAYTLQERERFTAELAGRPRGYEGRAHLLGRLRGTDVILAFIESYGVSAIDDPRYGRVLRPRLEEMEHRLGTVGLHMATGTLVAPTQGGQSWLSHGSLLSGVRVDNQIRYDLLVASGRESLVDDFEHAGYRTAAVMPAITMPWPEGASFGYDEIFVRRNMEYAGPPLNWVTMPDQYTWSFLERTVRTADDRPLFAVLGLISSHAPWTPILPVLDDWDGIGDGSIFRPWENAGAPPEELWLDTDRVREHYARSTEYAVHVVAAYAERYADDRTLIVALGDHQPAPLITGEDASRAVPVHVITGDPDLLEPFIDLGFRPGALPGAGATPRHMEAFRDWFVGAFSGPPGGQDAQSP